MLVGDVRVPLKPLNVDKPTAIEPFPCLSDTFGTLNSSTKEATVGTNETTSIKGHNDYVNGGKSNTRPASYDGHLNGEQNKKVDNFWTLIGSAGNGAVVAVSLESMLQVKELYLSVLFC